MERKSAGFPEPAPQSNLERNLADARFVSAFCLPIKLTAGRVGIRTVTRARSLEPRIVSDRLAEIDFQQRVLAHLGSGDLLSVAPRHERDLLFGFLIEIAPEIGRISSPENCRGIQPSPPQAARASGPTRAPRSRPNRLVEASSSLFPPRIGVSAAFRTADSLTDAVSRLNRHGRQTRTCPGM